MDDFQKACKLKSKIVRVHSAKYILTTDLPLIIIYRPNQFS